MFNNSFVFLGAAVPYQLSFQDPATPIMEGIINFHNDLMVFIVAICIFVLWMLVRCVNLYKIGLFSGVSKNLVYLGNYWKNVPDYLRRVYDTKNYLVGKNHHTNLEIFWTVIPALILMIIAVPSFALLYAMEEFIEPSLTIKCTGYQWYWGYEYSNFKKEYIEDHVNGVRFESYMIPTDDLEEGNLRLLEVDNRLFLPTNVHIQIVVTASDVLHCWAVPSLGVKIDACPGRLNQTSIFIKREGVFYGQCSEICGINHGFMPIVVNSTSLYNFMLVFYIDSILKEVEDEI